VLSHDHTGHKGRAGDAEAGLQRLREQVAEFALGLRHVHIETSGITEGGCEEKSADLRAVAVDHEQPRALPGENGQLARRRGNYHTLIRERQRAARRGDCIPTEPDDQEIHAHPVVSPSAVRTARARKASTIPPSVGSPASAYS